MAQNGFGTSPALRIAPVAPPFMTHRRLGRAAEEVVREPCRMPLPHAAVTAVVSMVDFCAILGAALLAAKMGQGSGTNMAAAALGTASGALTVLGLHGACVASAHAVCDPGRSLPRVAIVWAMVFLAVALGAAATGVRLQVPPAFAPGFFILASGLLLGGRGIAWVVIRHLAKAGLVQSRAVIVGNGHGASAILRALGVRPNPCIRVLGLFDDRSNGGRLDQTLPCPHLGALDELAEFIRRTRVDVVLFTLPLRSEPRILRMLETLWALPVDVRLVAHQAELRVWPRKCRTTPGMPAWEIAAGRQASRDGAAKALCDALLATILLVAGAIPAAVLALRLARRGGPVIVDRFVPGFDGTLIRVPEFALGPDEVSAGGGRRLLSAMRRYPALPAVLRASVSLVGPAPCGPECSADGTAEVLAGYFRRSGMKPGLVHWGCADGRPWPASPGCEAPAARDVVRAGRRDISYVENWSVLLDLQALAARAMAHFARKLPTPGAAAWIGRD